VSASRRARPVVVLALACALAGLHTVPARAATAPTPSIVWHGCGQGFQCGTLTVPRDRADPARATLDLAVIRVPARRARGRIGSLVFNPGGPGVPGVAFLRGIAASVPDELRDRFDLVAFDPRGIGLSNPIECENSLDPLFDQSFQPITPEARGALERAVATLVDACAARSGSLLAHVSTADTVQDLEQLRAALGDERLSFVGYSYGTFLGASYANAYPARVRALVLDGPVDPTMTATEVTLAQARGFEGALDDFLADCSQHRGCAFHHDGDAAGAYDALRTRAARAPLAAAHSGGRTLNQTRFDAAVLQQLYLGRAVWPALASALAAADNGDAASLLSIADAFVGRDAQGHDDHALDAFWAVSCLDGPVVEGLDASRALEARAMTVAPRLGAFIANNSLPCARWPVPPVAAPGLLTAAGAPPILVIGTTKDPATPLTQARALAHALASGRLLVVDGEQHTSFLTGNGCVDRAVTRYVVARHPPPAGTRC
jgi:pimeloyl-ACP methyl ester carboxylesterase